jgi:hypothetical protein
LRTENPFVPGLRAKQSISTTRRSLPHGHPAAVLRDEVDKALQDKTVLAAEAKQATTQKRAATPVFPIVSMVSNQGFDGT